VDLTATALAAAGKVLTVYADIMREHGAECGPALTRMYEVSASLAAEIDVLSMGLRTREVRDRIRKEQEDPATKLGAAWVAANDAAGACTFVREYLATTMGMQFVKDDAKK
jgi:hypothetical protein